jgi:hypothetical protein
MAVSNTLQRGGVLNPLANKNPVYWEIYRAERFPYRLACYPKGGMDQGWAYYVFLTFEDETDLYETVIFPQVYDRYNTLLFDQFPLLIQGKVCEERGALSLEIEKMERIM